MFLVLLYLLLPAFGQRGNERPIITFKKQIGLNFRHEETPWNYLAVQQFNTFFNQSQYQDAYLGTVLPPFYVDFYSNHRYKYLPLVTGQDFFPEKEGLLNQMKIGNNIALYYTDLLKKNHQVFVSNYYLNNLRGWQIEFDNLLKQFDVRLMKEGCLGSCNIYQLSLKTQD